jgi:hypothetical protein
LKSFTFDELDVLGGKARRAEYIAAKAEGRLQEAGFTERPRELRVPPKPEVKSEPRPEQKRETPLEPAQSKKSEQPPKNEQRHGKQHYAKQAVKPEKKQPVQQPVQKEAAEAAQDNAPVKKPAKRHHRGGKGRNKFPGQKPAGGAPTEAKQE